jgi:hypothetical protein
MSSPAPIALLAGEPLGARVMWVNGFVAFPSP